MTSSSTLNTAEDVVDVDVAEMADAQRLPGELALAAGDHEVAVEERRC